ncbi:hypothetical protein GH714_010663 [Hevea brasiliensis]|uniref:Uncharacterized protein n=1 Tax=Hevea brasiliensis TaxID=3981 RepID=A0A6A6NBM9_HEVBR|nr:hypothetical protein GH714_010663 [Hevea brasiliensis]
MLRLPYNQGRVQGITIPMPTCKFFMATQDHCLDIDWEISGGTCIFEEEPAEAQEQDHVEGGNASNAQFHKTPPFHTRSKDARWGMILAQLDMMEVTITTRLYQMAAKSVHFEEKHVKNFKRLKRPID